MDKLTRVDPKGQTMLNAEEVGNITGGLLVEKLARIACSISEYFFRMGVTEAKRMKALL